MIIVFFIVIVLIVAFSTPSTIINFVLIMLNKDIAIDSSHIKITPYGFLIKECSVQAANDTLCKMQDLFVSWGLDINVKSLSISVKIDSTVPVTTKDLSLEHYEKCLTGCKYDDSKWLYVIVKTLQALTFFKRVSIQNIDVNNDFFVRCIFIEQTKCEWMPLSFRAFGSFIKVYANLDRLIDRGANDLSLRIELPFELDCKGYIKNLLFSKDIGSLKIRGGCINGKTNITTIIDDFRGYIYINELGKIFYKFLYEDKEIAFGQKANNMFLINSEYGNASFELQKDNVVIGTYRDNIKFEIFNLSKQPRFNLQNTHLTDPIDKERMTGVESTKISGVSSVHNDSSTKTVANVTNEPYWKISGHWDAKKIFFNGHIDKIRLANGVLGIGNKSISLECTANDLYHILIEKQQDIIIAKCNKHAIRGRYKAPYIVFDNLKLDTSPGRYKINAKNFPFEEWIINGLCKINNHGNGDFNFTVSSTRKFLRSVIFKAHGAVQEYKPHNTICSVTSLYGINLHGTYNNALIIDGTIDTGSMNNNIWKIPSSITGIAHCHITYDTVLGGSIMLSNGSFSIPNLNAFFKNMNVLIDLKALKIKSFSAVGQNNGTLTGEGTLSLDEITLGLQLKNVTVFDTEYLLLDATGNMNIKGWFQNWHISGELTSNASKVWIDEFGFNDSINFINKDREPQTTKMSFDILVSLNNMRMKGFGLDSTWYGKIFYKTPGVCVGKMQLKKGDLFVGARKILINKGFISFEENDPNNPFIHVMGSWQNKINGSILVNGKPASLKIEFFSDRNLSKNEILSYMLFDKALKDISVWQTFNLLQVISSLGKGTSFMQAMYKAQKKMRIRDIDIKKNSTNGTNLILEFAINDWLSVVPNIGTNTADVSAQVKLNNSTSIEASRNSIKLNFNKAY